MEPTICVECKHFRKRELASVRADIWYNHTCTAHPLARVFNFVTGKQEPQKYADCRDINTRGKCAKFERKT